MGVMLNRDGQVLKLSEDALLMLVDFMRLLGVPGDDLLDAESIPAEQAEIYATALAVVLPDALVELNEDDGYFSGFRLRLCLVADPGAVCSPLSEFPNTLSWLESFTALCRNGSGSVAISQ